MINYQNMKYILESILVEDKLSDLQDRYKDIHPDTIKDIWNNGVPSNNQGKYIDWSIRENNKEHNPSRTKQALEVYDRNKDKIGKFNHQWSIDDLESITHPFTDEGKSFNKKAEEGTTTASHGDIIVKTHSNHESAVKGGFLHPDNDCFNSTKEPGKAQWCVSANSEVGENYFNNTYTSNGKYPLYTIENKSDKTKTAVVLNPNRNPELRDEYDKELKPYQVLYRHPSLAHTDLGNKLLGMKDTKEMLDHVPINATEAVLLKGLDNSSPYVREAVVSHPKATEAVLLKGLDDGSPYVRGAAVSHPKATEAVLLKGLDNSAPYVREAAVSHPKATEAVLLKGLDDISWNVREAVVRHPKATEPMLLKGLDDTNLNVREAVIRHPKATEAVLLKGLDNSAPYVRGAAVSHPKATEAVLLKGLDDTNLNVREAVIRHPKATEAVLLKGLDDGSPYVRGAAVSHPKATEAVLLKGLDNSAPYVREAAVSHPKATEAVLLKGLDNTDWTVRNLASQRLSNMREDS